MDMLLIDQKIVLCFDFGEEVVVEAVVAVVVGDSPAGSVIGDDKDDCDDFAVVVVFVCEDYIQSSYSFFIHSVFILYRFYSFYINSIFILIFNIIIIIYIILKQIGDILHKKYNKY